MKDHRPGKGGKALEPSPGSDDLPGGPDAKGGRASSARPMVEHGRQAEGLTNGHADGLTNGAMRPAGLTNGFAGGLTNGFVNGSGAVNGFRISSKDRRLGAPPMDVRRKMLVVAALVAVIMVIPYALVYAFPPAEVEIDGHFMDWVRATVYEDEPDSPNPDTAISAYAFKSDSRGTYFYIATAGTVMNGADGGADAFYLFLDRDGDPGTGYSVRGLGADHMFAVVGWNVSAFLKASYTFSPSSDRDDFGGFKRSSDPLAAFRGGELEVGTDVLTGQHSRVAICARHTGSADDWSEVNFARSGPAVHVVQDHVAPEVTSGRTDERMLELTVSVKERPAEVSGMAFEFLGDASPYRVSVMRGSDTLGSSAVSDLDFVRPLVVRPGEPQRLEVLVSFPEGSEGRSFGIRLDAAGGLALAPNSTLTVGQEQRGARSAYVMAPPDGVVVDGAFGDWSGRFGVVDPLGDVVTNGTGLSTNGDVDISEVKVWSSESTAYFFMSVDGTMLGGSSVPGSVARWVEPPEPGGSMPNVTEDVRLFGADFAYAFIDSDSNASSGFYVGGAEAALVVVGKHGSVMAAKVYSYDGVAWSLTGDVDAALDMFRLEMGCPYALLGLEQDGSYRVTFMAQDWRGSGDTASAALLAGSMDGTRTIGGILMNELFSSVPAMYNDWIELYNTGTVPISIDGWTLYADGVLVCTFSDVTIYPGEFYVEYDLYFGKATLFVLYDAAKVEVDTVTVPAWKSMTYGRTGTPETGYEDWEWMTPTPGLVNDGQVPIPEFGDLLAPLAIVPIMFMLIRHARRTRISSEGNSDGDAHGRA